MKLPSHSAIMLISEIAPYLSILLTDMERSIFSGGDEEK